jgi:hypothetical protein
VPSTQYNLDRILDRARDYTPAQILQVMDEVQKIVYSEPTEQTICLDPTTGMPPYLVTIAGQFEYDAPANCRQTAAVFAVRYPYPSRNYGYEYFHRGYVHSGREYYQVMVNSRPALPQSSTVAKVIFPFDPGDTTSEYYHKYWILPPDLDDVGTELVLPEHTHWRFRGMCLRMLLAESTGDNAVESPEFERGIKKIRKELNSGANVMSSRVPIASEYRDYPDDFYHSTVQ